VCSITQCLQQWRIARNASTLSLQSCTLICCNWTQWRATSTTPQSVTDVQPRRLILRRAGHRSASLTSARSVMRHLPTSIERRRGPHASARHMTEASDTSSQPRRLMYRSLVQRWTTYLKGNKLSFIFQIDHCRRKNQFLFGREMNC